MMARGCEIEAKKERPWMLMLADWCAILQEVTSQERGVETFEAVAPVGVSV